MTDTQIIVAVCAAAFVALCVWLWPKESEPEPEADPQAEFRAAKSVMDRPRYDSETGEWYAFKISRVPAQAPLEKRDPVIAEPMQRKART